MSRVGRLPIAIPAGVTVAVSEENVVTVKGPKGELVKAMNKDMNIAVENNEILVTRPSDDKEHRALHGLTRALINNMVIGVSEGYQKTLELVGVGYRAQLQGKKLVIKGIDKEVVGAQAADIRAWRKPEPYKGKGIKFEGEFIRRKEGKTGKK